MRNKVYRYLKMLSKKPWELASTLTEEEKQSVRTLTSQFLSQHYYFTETWKFLSDTQKSKVLDIISEGKGFIPREKIFNMSSLFCTPENRTFFLKKDGFF